MNKIEIAQEIAHNFPLQEVIELTAMVNREEFTYHEQFENVSLSLLGYSGKEKEALIYRADDVEYEMIVYPRGDDDKDMLAELLCRLNLSKDEIVEITKKIIDWLNEGI
jgi:hypothetical protein